MQLAYTAVETAALVRDIALIVFFAISAIGIFVGIILGIKFYKRTSNVVDRVDNMVGKVENAVSTVEGAANNVKSTATAVNRGMRVGAFAKSAVDTVFGGRGDKRDKSEHEAEESSESRKKD